METHNFKNESPVSPLGVLSVNGRQLMVLLVISTALRAMSVSLLRSKQLKEISPALAFLGCRESSAVEVKTNEERRTTDRFMVLSV